MTEPVPVFRCGEAARGRADPLVGSAPPAQRWLLLEHPGPWRIDAVAGSGLAPAMLPRLTQSAQQAQTRVLLIRRPGRRTGAAERRWILASATGPTVTGRWVDDHDLEAAAEAVQAAMPTGSPASDPLVLVCTHGVHDTCCAVRGRPVAAALADRWPDYVWECSHVGGDRFAPNVVLLPDGYYYGNLEPESAVATVASHLSGVVQTEHLRGVAAFPPAGQAAAVAVYERFGPLAPHAVALRSVEHFPPRDRHGSTTTVQLQINGRPSLIEVEVLAVRREAALLTCRATRETPATEYQVTSLRLRG